MEMQSLKRMSRECGKVPDYYGTYIEACAAVADEMVSEVLETMQGDPKTLGLLGLQAIHTSTANGYNKATALERLALIHSEVSECLEAIRHNCKDFFEVDGKPQGPLSELADVIIRTVEIDDIVRAKMEYNKIRKDVPVRDGTKSI